MRKGRRGAILSEEIDNVLLNGATRTDIKVRDGTPQLMLEVGVRDLPMLMSHVVENILTEAEARKRNLRVDKSVHYHGLGKELFIEVIESLDRPAAIFQWQPNSTNNYGNKDYIILTSLLNRENERIIVPIFVETRGNHLELITGEVETIDTNKVKTIYGKNHVFQFLNKYIQEGSLRKLR